MAAGAEFGLRDAGYYAIEWLRLEKGYRAWGRELTPDDTPWQAGLGWAVKLDKGGFIGREALIDAKAKPLTRRLRRLVLRGGRAARCGAARRCCATAGRSARSPRRATATRSARRWRSAMWRDGAPRSTRRGSTARFEVDIAGVRVAVRASLKAPYDPSSARTRFNWDGLAAHNSPHAESPPRSGGLKARSGGRALHRQGCVLRGSPPARPRMRAARMAHRRKTQTKRSLFDHVVPRGARSVGGTVRPRALALLRLIRSSKAVGLFDRKSAGLAPLRILSMNTRRGNTSSAPLKFPIRSQSGRLPTARSQTRGSAVAFQGRAQANRRCRSAS